MQKIEFDIVRTTPGVVPTLAMRLVGVDGTVSATGEIGLDRLAWVLEPMFQLNFRPEQTPLDPDGSMERQKPEAFR